MKTLFTEFRLARRAALALAFAGTITAVTVQPLLARPGDGPSEVAVEALMNQPELADLVMGSPDAKVTIVESASMTCGHCKNFHTKVLPELKTSAAGRSSISRLWRACWRPKATARTAPPRPA